MPNHTNKQGLVHCILCNSWKASSERDVIVKGFDYIYCAECLSDRTTLYEKYYAAVCRMASVAYSSTPERVEKTKKWRAENPEKAKSHQAVSSGRRRARKANLLDDWTTQDWARCLEYWGHKCAVCGRPVGLWHTLASDHWIPLSSPNCPGTTATNIIPLCHGLDGCNNSKCDNSPQEWLIRKVGNKKAKRILCEIEAYFNWVKLIGSDD